MGKANARCSYLRSLKYTLQICCGEKLVQNSKRKQLKWRIWGEGLLSCTNLWTTHSIFMGNLTAISGLNGTILGATIHWLWIIYHRGGVFISWKQTMERPLQSDVQITTANWCQLFNTNKVCEIWQHFKYLFLHFANLGQ